MNPNRWIVLIGVLGSLSVLAEPLRLAQAAPATLDNAVLVSASVDRGEVYLGEALTLTLEYWELDLRGLKVQPFYRGGTVDLPNMEGFYAGPLETERDDAARDGMLYSVTRYRQRLYPAIAGDLEIGPWRWQGSVQGYTAAGRQNGQVDLSTEAIPVRVLPLPTPPSTFRGAVGEFSVSLSLAANELTQGVPAALTVEVMGTGNPGTLAAPILPEATWYTTGDPREDAEPVPDPGSGKFVKPFHYDLMPITPGNQRFPSVSFTYYSPAARQYKSVRTEPATVRVAASGPAESLIVVGGGTGATDGAALMEDGKRMLAQDTPTFAIRREIPGLKWMFLAVPPAIWLVMLLRDHGRTARTWRGPRRRNNPLTTQFAAISSQPQPVEALDGLLRGVLARLGGHEIGGMSAVEIRVWLEERASAEEAARISGAFQACQDHRYGKRTLGASDIGDLIQGLAEAVAGLERRLRQGRRS